MTLTVAGCITSLYSIGQSNNILSYADLAKRVALAAVPFLKLHVPLNRPLSIAMDARRVWTVDYKDVVGTAVAVIALASTIFQHRIGKIITTIQSVFIDLGKVRKGEDCEEVSKSLIKIANNIVSLAFMAFGGFELAVIGLVMQPVISLIVSRDEFKKDRWIEGTSNFIMSGVRFRQSSTGYQFLIKK